MWGGGVVVVGGPCHSVPLATPHEYNPPCVCLQFSSELLVLLPNHALNHVFWFRVHKLHSLDL